MAHEETRWRNGGKLKEIHGGLRSSRRAPDRKKMRKKRKDEKERGRRMRRKAEDEDDEEGMSGGWASCARIALMVRSRPKSL
eukprot:4529524-Pyramimonas_sp.AAC.1